jgi:hypothetical protein
MHVVEDVTHAALEMPTGREVMEELWRQRRAGADPKGREQEAPAVGLPLEI